MKDERELIPHLKKELETKRYFIKTTVSLPRCKIENAWVTWKGKVIDRFAQPDIDILYVHPAKKTLHAVEVKLFKKKGKRVNYPFYEGIGEALALLRFGVEHVSLWHYFEDSVNVREMEVRAIGARNLIRGLQLPIGYKCVRLIVTPKEIEENLWIEFCVPESRNPYFGTPEAQLVYNYIKSNVLRMLQCQ